MVNLELTKDVESVLSGLQINKEPFFKQLWTKQRLEYENGYEAVDVIDKSNAALICTALNKKHFFLNVLPDNAVHRAPLLFGTALIKSAVDCIQNKLQGKTVLYYGTSSKLKHTISKMSVNGISLDSVFTSTQLSGKYKKTTAGGNPSAEYLPKVVCVYNPVSPEQYIQIYHPDWIAVDCYNQNELEWLSPLLTYCAKKTIPVIGWSENSFSKSVLSFEQASAKIFYAPQKQLSTPTANFGSLLLNGEAKTVSPIVLDGEEVEKIDSLLSQAKTILSGVKWRCTSPLKTDAVKAAWKFVLSLEKLTLPLQIYNTESKAFWNIFPINEIKKGLERYIEVIDQYDHKLAKELEKCHQLLTQVYLLLESKDPPYWSVLSNYVMDRPVEGSLRVIIFNNRTQKRLFSYCLLARFNLNEIEVFNDSKVIFRTIKDFENPNHSIEELSKEFNLNLIFVGLPEAYNISAFYHCVNKYSIEVLLYKHQVGALKSTLNSFNSKQKEQTKVSLNTLEKLSDIKLRSTPILSERYGLSSPTRILHVNLNNSISNRESDYSSTVQINDLQTELAKLFETDQEDDDKEYLVNINLNNENSSDNRENSFLVENAVQLKLEGGFMLFLDPSDQINVIKNKEVFRVFARAVAPGNAILCIQNQAKKDLFDILIERIHEHNSLAFHLNLLQKWREEFHSRYLLWSKTDPDNNLKKFWQLLRNEGSDVSTELTISNWLNGYTLRPQDGDNIKRIGKILGSSFIIEHAQEIINAASRIVGLHISLSRKLKNWLDGSVYDLKKEDMVMIDDELTLTLGELRSSMGIFKVLEISINNIPVHRNSLGILQKI